MPNREPLVLLPGMMCDARLFFPQLSAFSADRAVMVAPLTGQSSIHALAEQVLDTAPKRFALAGLSMGGIVAMEIARQAPHRLTRLALLDTNPLADPPDRKTIRDRQMASVAAGRLHEVMRDEMKPHYLAYGPRRLEILDLCMVMANTLGSAVFETQSLALRNRADQRENLTHLDLPVLVLCGEADSLCPPERHELMHELVTDSTLVVVPDAGHLPTLEQADYTNNALLEWLK